MTANGPVDLLEQHVAIPSCRQVIERMLHTVDPCKPGKGKVTPYSKYPHFLAGMF